MLIYQLIGHTQKQDTDIQTTTTTKPRQTKRKAFDATDDTIGYLPETEGKTMAEGITCLSHRTWRYLPGADLLAP